MTIPTPKREPAKPKDATSAEVARVILWNQQMADAGNEMMRASRTPGTSRRTVQAKLRAYRAIERKANKLDRRLTARGRKRTSAFAPQIKPQQPQRTRAPRQHVVRASARTGSESGDSDASSSSGGDADPDPEQDQDQIRARRAYSAYGLLAVSR